MRIARLRPRPFSSTTVALASCSSDHFPKRSVYISDVREGICPRAQARILSRIVYGPRWTVHSLHQNYGLCRRPELSDEASRRSGWLAAGSPCSDAGTLATTQRSMGGDSTQQHTIRLLGTAMFHLCQPALLPAPLP